MSMEPKFEDIELYHYTSLEALKSIVENKTIRFTDYRFLNDPDELNIALDNFKEYIKAQIEKQPENKAKIDRILNIIEDIKVGGKITIEDTGKVIDKGKLYAFNKKVDSWVYILSLTQKSDDLALWTMYGKNGVRIKLNSSKLFGFIYRFRDKYMRLDNPYRGKVEYDKQIISYASLLQMIINDNIISQVYDTILQVLLREKSNAFEYEAEYRIALNVSDDFVKGKDDIKKLFVVKDNILKPQIELSDFPVQDIIEDVIISPYNHSDCATLGVKEFLKCNLKKDIPVNRSTIKIR